MPRRPAQPAAGDEADPSSRRAEISLYTDQIRVPPRALVTPHRDFAPLTNCLDGTSSDILHAP